VLKNTLVCENIDIATNLGYSENRYRCVTKEGVVIENYGAMTGSGKPKSGGMGSSLQFSNTSTFLNKDLS
jgi:structural maintenance of chromosome 4